MMKKILTLALILTATIGLGMSAKDKKEGGTPGIHFTKVSHDFGQINEKGGPVKCEFEFVNDGDAPLVIVTASASCGCTRPKFPPHPIAPGKGGKIQVTFIPEGHPGEIDKIVTVRTNVPSKKKVKLRLKGYVIPAQK